MTTETYTLPEMVDALRTFILQRPGFEPGNYHTAASYRADVRAAGQARSDALALLRPFDGQLKWGTPESVAQHTAALQAELTGAGRLTLRRAASGRVVLDYCAGQYWCTEYRRAAARALANALWQMAGADMGWKPGCGDALRRSFRNWFGRGIASRYFR